MRRKKDIPTYHRNKSDPIEYVENSTKSKLNLSRNMKGSISNYSIPILDSNLLEIGEEIGRGSYSTVYLGKYRGTLQSQEIEIHIYGESSKNEILEGETQNKISQVAVKIFADNSGKKMVFRKKQAWKFSPEEEFNKQYRIFTRLCQGQGTPIPGLKEPAGLAGGFLLC